MTVDRVDFYRHQLGDAEAESVAETLRTLFLTTGPRTAEFERRLAELEGVAHGVGLSSCTSALFLSLQALGVGPGDEVITTPMTFIATANVVLHCGATPVFVDVEPDTGNLDVAAVEAAITERTKVVLPVHLYGQMVDMRALSALAERRGLRVVEDAAHALEAERDGVRPGQLSDAACFSFYATKNLTCGEGGAIVSRSDEVADAVRVLRTHGMTKNAYQRYEGNYRHWDMTALGYKANLPDVLAALLLPQLDGIEGKRAARERIAERYTEAFAGVPGVTVPTVREGTRHAHHLYTIWVDAARRDRVLDGLQSAGVGVAVNYRAIHLLSYYRERFGFEPGAFPNAERIGDSTLSLPMFPGLRDDEIDRVIEVVRDVVR